MNLIFTQGPAQSTWIRSLSKNEKGELGYIAYMNAWEPYAIEACSELQPDIIICDYFSRVGCVAGD